MALKAKLDLLSLSDEERAKAQEKFLATLALVSEDELREVIGYLSSQGVQISRAREIKVLGDTKAEIAKKFSILGEIHEEGIYIQDPTQIPRNAIDIYKKIKYCIQNGRTYKREDGTYEPFLFSEAAWQAEFNRESTIVTEVSAVKPLNDTIVTVEPVVAPELDLGEPVVPVSTIVEDTDHIDIGEYMKATDDVAELEAKTTNFAAIRKELEGQLAELDALKSMNFSDEISFTDLEPESYGMGRAA